MVLSISDYCCEDEVTFANLLSNAIFRSYVFDIKNINIPLTHSEHIAYTSGLSTRLRILKIKYIII